MIPRSHIHKILGGVMMAAAMVFTPVFALAQTPTTQSQGNFANTVKGGLEQAAPAELKTDNTVQDIVGGILSAALGLLGVVLFGYLLYGGYLWMTAGGDSGKVKTAIDVIKNAIIGLVVITVAYALANFVIGQLGKALEAGSTTVSG